MTDAGGVDTGLRRYDAFGSLSYFTGPIFSSEFGFGGLLGYQSEYFDATEPGLGLQYLAQRYYDPAIGRFLTPDPIGFAGGLNLYGYVGHDPVNAVDPFGLSKTYRDRTIIDEDDGSPRYDRMYTSPLAIRDPKGVAAAAQFHDATFMGMVPGYNAVTAATGENVYGQKLSRSERIWRGFSGFCAAASAFFGRLRPPAGARSPLPRARPWTNPGRLLTTAERDALRREAQSLWARATQGRAWAAGLQIHHRVPLEYAHLTPGDPNRWSNLVGVDTVTNQAIGRIWTAFRTRLKGRTPSAREVMEVVFEIDRLYGHQMVFLR